MTEVVSANSADLAKLSCELQEGLYVVGSGSTGASEALALCGGLYLFIMMSSAFILKRPPKGYLPKGYVPPPVAQTLGNVNLDTVMKTP